MKTDHSDNDRHPQKRTGTEDRFSREIFDKHNELFKVGQLITSEIDYDVLFDVIINETNRIMDVERCSIFLLDEKGEMLNAFASAGVGGLSIQVPKSEGIVGWVFNNREPALVNNVAKDKRFYPEVDKKSPSPTRNILCVPGQQKKGVYRRTGDH